MKTLLMLALVITLHADQWSKWNTEIEKSGYDYVPHYIVGGIASYYTYELLPDDMPKWAKQTIAIAVPMIIGATKETFDNNYDQRDVQEYVIGGFIGLSVQCSF